MWRYSVALVAAMLLLGIAMEHGVLHGIDHAISSTFSLRVGDASVPFWYGVSWSGGGTQRYIAVILLSLGLGIWLHWRAGLALALTSLVSNLTSEALKEAFGRPRPGLVPHLDPTTSLSFPSGHATSAMLVYIMVALLVPTQRRGLWLAGALVLAFLTGWSRIMLGVHWFSDVLAGWMLGLAFALAGTWLVRRSEGKAIDVAPHNG